jgi:hypothetical protein
MNTKTNIQNTATASVAQVPNSQSQSVTTPLVQNPQMSVSKTASLQQVNAAGTRILYSVVIANGGNVDLANMNVRDDLITLRGGNDLSCAPTANRGTLLVGASTTCTGSYVVSAADMTNGSPIVNSAVVSANLVPTQTANASTAIIQSPSFTAAKTASVQSVNSAGSIINYAITVANTGNIALPGPFRRRHARCQPQLCARRARCFASHVVADCVPRSLHGDAGRHQLWR